MTRTALIVLTVLALAAPAMAADAAFDIPLTVREHAGVARTGDPVTGGVPFPRGVLKDAGQVRLLNADGKEVPAQFEVINRWGQDDSIMWLLVIAQTDLPANGETTFRVVPGKPTRQPNQPIVVQQEEDRVTVTAGEGAGSHRMPLKTKPFELFRSTMTLPNGQTYTSTAAAPEQVVVEEDGPVRATILIRGRHTFAGQGDAALPYLYGYEFRIRAYAGSEMLRVSYTLTNSHTPVIGMPLVKDASMSIVAPRDLDDTLSGDGWAAGSYKGEWNLIGLRYLAENSPASVAAKGNALELRPWGDKPQYLDIYTRKTYELLLGELSGGDKAAGDAAMKRFSSPLRFWVAPDWITKARAWSDFGYVAVPDEATAKAITRRFTPFNMKGYAASRLKQDWSQNAWRHQGADPEFESGSSSAPGGGYEPLLKTAHLYLTYLQTGDRRFWDEAEKVSWHWRDRRYIHIDKPFADVRWEGSGFYRTHYLEGMKKYADLQPPAGEINWIAGAWNYGGRWGPMDTQHFSVDEVVNYYYLTGDRACLEALQMYGQQAMGFVNRAIADGGDVSRAHGWVARALVACYEATNDPKFLKAARDMVNYIVEHQDRRAGTISPVDKKEKDGKPARQVPFMAAAVGMALGRYYRHYPEENVRDAIIGLADWLYYDMALPGKGFGYSWYVDNPGGWSPSGHRCMSTMGWAYLATGQKRYMEAADLHAGKGDGVDARELAYWQVNGFGQEYITLKNTKREDATPPAAVTDLAAVALGGGKVKVTWTAPGDDDKTGAVADVQVKYSDKAIVEHADWRTKADQEISFWAATNVATEPAPAAAGTAQSCTVEGLTPGARLYFALKTYDEQPNMSDLSNVVAVEVK